MTFQEAIGRLKAFEGRMKGVDTTPEDQGKLMFGRAERSDKNKSQKGRGRNSSGGNGKGLTEEVEADENNDEEQLVNTEQENWDDPDPVYATENQSALRRSSREWCLLKIKPVVPVNNERLLFANAGLSFFLILTDVLLLTQGFLHIDEYPPDANQGFDIPSAIVSYPDFHTRLQYKEDNDSIKLPMVSKMQGKRTILSYTEVLLVPLTTPDFSMPYNQSEAPYLIDSYFQFCMVHHSLISGGGKMGRSGMLGNSSVEMYEVERPEPSTARKRKTSAGDGEGSSRKRRVIGEEDSSEDEEMSVFLPEKEVVFPSSYAVAMREAKSPFVDASPQRAAEEGVSGPSGSVTQLIEEMGSLAARLQVSYADEASSVMRKDAEIARLQAQLAEARAEAESSGARADRLAGEKVALLLQVEKEHSLLESHQASCRWIRGYMDQWRVHHFDQLEVLRGVFQSQLREQEEKLRKMTLEYDEELYPHLMQMIAERRCMMG
ncbi:GPI transamidase component Gpi16 subunit family protein [Artemisia annua]|uniref:GPI transamidase component Gpi16 subunit family protein n=1 Tax=Artemisia annua TaxID=35608 RepID=A0A2U1Q3V6_ARTAN|nr:GPI transamidase component Gpi16 subunit family protein [Artemisia annua]